MMSQDTQAKNVVFFHPDLGIGGAERLVVDAAVGLQKRGHRVTIFTSHCDPSHCFDEARDGTLDVRVRGNALFPPSVFGRLSILCAILRQIHLVLQICLLSSELHELKPDVFFVDQLSSCIPLLRSLYPRARTLFYCHFPDKLLASRPSIVKELYRIPFDWLEGWTTGISDVIIVNSNFTKAVFAEAFPQLQKRDPHVVYPCVIANEKSSDASLANLIWPSKRVVLSINRFERKKDIGLAVKAFARLSAREKSGARVAIAGGYDPRMQENVSYHKELCQLASSLGLTHATVLNEKDADDVSESVEVVFLPSVSSTLKERLLRSSQLLVYTPKYEHFGIVPLEAMLAQLPVLAATTGGPKESVVDGETGWLRSVDNISSWTKVMALVLSELSQAQLHAMGARGRQRVQAVFSQGAMAERLESEVREMLATENRPPLTSSGMRISLAIILPSIFAMLYVMRGS